MQKILFFQFRAYFFEIEPKSRVLTIFRRYKVLQLVSSGHQLFCLAQRVTMSTVSPTLGGLEVKLSQKSLDLRPKLRKKGPFFAKLVHVNLEMALFELRT